MVKLLLQASVLLFTLSTVPYVVRGSGLQLELLSPDLVVQRLKQGHVEENDRQSLVETLFREMGCEVSRQPIDKKAGNVICDLPGKTNATIVIGAHFDFANEGQGIVDDWSGTSMLVLLYHTLKSQTWAHSYKFVAFAGEERGLVGSKRFVKELRTRSNLVPEAPKVWLSRANPSLAQKLAAVANGLQVPLQVVNIDKVGDDDTHPFLANKIPVITIHSVTQQTLPVLHSPKDTIEAINRDNYFDAYRLVAFYLAYLDASLHATTTSNSLP